MAEPFLSEIRIASFNFAPKGWALCDGQLLPINQNQALFSLLGTTYGGDGETNFALPDLQGRAPVHTGGGLLLGERGGEESHALALTEMPTHTHLWEATSASGDTPTPAGAAILGAYNNAYNAGASLVSAAPATLSNVGGSQAHQNMQPYLVLTFIIALQGIFPSQN